MAHRNLWLIDMGDGTWVVCCMACRLARYRGPKAGADAPPPATPANPSCPSAAGAGRPDTWDGLCLVELRGLNP
jgi:hypothetical protein